MVKAQGAYHAPPAKNKTKKKYATRETQTRQQHPSAKNRQKTSNQRQHQQREKKQTTASDARALEHSRKLLGTVDKIILVESNALSQQRGAHSQGVVDPATRKGLCYCGAQESIPKHLTACDTCATYIRLETTRYHTFEQKLGSEQGCVYCWRILTRGVQRAEKKSKRKRKVTKEGKRIEGGGEGSN